MSALIIALSCLSCVIGEINKGKDFFYTGYGIVSPSDRMVYLSQIEQARQGHFLFKNLYTSESQTGLIFSPLFLVIGIFSKLTLISPLLSYYIFRSIFAFFLLWFIYFFISKVFMETRWRYFVFIIACFIPGLSIFSLRNLGTDEIILSHVGVDLVIPEATFFMSIFHSPLFVLSQILVLFVFWWIVEHFAKATFYETIALSSIIVLLGILHPYDLFIIFPVAGIWLILDFIKRKKIYLGNLFKYAILLFGAAITLMYFFWLSKTEPAFAVWADQNITLSQPIWLYILGYGLLFPFYIFGIIEAVKSKKRWLSFLAIWSIIAILLIYFPVQFQRRLINCAYLAISIVAVFGFKNIISFASSWKMRYKVICRFILMTFVAIFFATNFFFVIYDACVSTFKVYPYYFSMDYKNRLDWLKEHADEKDIVLSSSNNGIFIPAFAGRIVFLGHGHQTGDWTTKKAFVEGYFFKSNKGDEEKQAWLYKESIDYLFFSKQEDDLGDFNPWEKNYLEPVSSGNEATIFKVILPQ